MTGFAFVFQTAYAILSPFLAIGVLALGYWGVAVLRQHGYQATYAAAIVRAMGAGMMAAQSKGLDPFSGEGRSLVLQTGAAYLNSTVGDTAKALGINVEGHVQRVDAQLGVIAAQAEATAQAVSTVKAGDLVSALKEGIASGALLPTATLASVAAQEARPPGT